ncbi:hypothetical protein PEA_00450 [Erwinia phage phiEa1H]|uniref:Uncharacterized protein n=1 Tax=Erwinia phage Era103 TaxID=418443 RepID=A2I816_9CAUD|nr:hypothetical protein Era103g48 [Erwinia phage Era103]ABM63438.1 hypothetical protein Era103g48 [Erwinia phage Era103]CBX44506.1 hypothetical protein PEA_00450 [Erwinia phage phiEa1H]
MLSVTGEKPRNRKVTVTALVAPLVLMSALEDVDDPINDYALSGKEAGATVYAVTSGTLTAPTGIELRIATGNQPEDPWVANTVDPGEVKVSSDSISDAGDTGKALIKAKTTTEAKTALNILRADITDMSATGRELTSKVGIDATRQYLQALSQYSTATATVKGPVLMAPRQVGVNLTSTGDTASTATDVAGLLVDLNDLISKYNTLRTDVTSVNTNLNSVIVALKASGAITT